MGKLNNKIKNIKWTIGTDSRQVNANKQIFYQVCFSDCQLVFLSYYIYLGGHEALAI